MPKRRCRANARTRFLSCGETSSQKVKALKDVLAQFVHTLLLQMKTYYIRRCREKLGFVAHRDGKDIYSLSCAAVFAH